MKKIWEENEKEVGGEYVQIYKAKHKTIKEKTKNSIDKKENEKEAK